MSTWIVIRVNGVRAEKPVRPFQHVLRDWWMIAEMVEELIAGNKRAAALAFQYLSKT